MAALNASAGLEWLSPLLIAGEPLNPGTLRLVNYAVVLGAGPLRTSAGAVEVELPSHVLFPLVGPNSIDSRLTVASSATSTQMAGFAGKMLSSSGFNLSLLNFAGGSFKVASTQGTSFYSMAVRTEADDKAGGLVLFGVEALLAGAQTYLEYLMTLSPDDAAGYGLVTGFTFRGERSGLTAAFFGRDLMFETPLLATGMAERTRAELRATGYRVFGRTFLTYNLAGAYGHRTGPEAGIVAVNTDATLRFAASDKLTLSTRYQSAERYAQSGENLWQASGTRSAGGEILYAAAGQAGGKGQLNLEALFAYSGEFAGIKAGGSVTQSFGPGSIYVAQELSSKRDLQGNTFSYHTSVTFQSADRPIDLFGSARLTGLLGVETQITDVSGSTSESLTAALAFRSKLDLGLTDSISLTADGKYSFETNGPDYRLKLSLRYVF